MRALVIAAIVGCGSPPAPRPHVAPVAPQPKLSELEQWLARIPRECLDEPAPSTLACERPELPATMCVVDLTDDRSRNMTDLYVFDGDRLLRQHERVSDLQTHERDHAYDARGRKIREDDCMTAGAGKASSHPAWREPMVEFEHPTTSVTRTEIRYVGDTTRPAFAETRSSSTSNGVTITTSMRLCYAYDAIGRRVARYEVYRTSDQPRRVFTMIRSYTYGRARAGDPLAFNGRPLRMRSRHVVIEDAARIVHEREWTAAFGYDRAGRPDWVDAGGSRTRYRYDRAGRLISYNGVARLAWDGPRLVELAIPPASRTYAYDASGRLRAGQTSHGGFRVTYSVTCPATLAHPAFTPNADNFQYYEGKDHL